MYNISSCSMTALPSKYRHSCVLEIRKKKSRDAARHRRGKENCEFYELSKLLPLPSAITSQLDKASIIRLSISFLKLRTFSSRDCSSLVVGRQPARFSITEDQYRWSQRNDYLQNSSNRLPCGPHAGVITWSSSATSINTAFDTFDSSNGPHLLQSLDGFVFATSRDGRFLYVSETVSVYLGLSQVEMIGSDMFEYVHADDRLLLADMCNLLMTSRYTQHSAQDDLDYRQKILDDGQIHCERMQTFRRCFTVRMKSMLVKRGAIGKTAGYRVVQITAQLRPVSQCGFSSWSQSFRAFCSLVAVANVLPSPSGPEILLDGIGTLVMRLTADFRVIHCEPRIGDHVGLHAFYLNGMSLYQCCHPADVSVLQQAHNELMTRGQSMTSYYRLLCQSGGYVWVQTCFSCLETSSTPSVGGKTTSSASVATDDQFSGSQSVIAINYILSGIEHSRQLLSIDQCDFKCDTNDRFQHQSDCNQGNRYIIVRNCSSVTTNDHVASSHSNVVKQILDLDALCVVEADMTSSLDDDVMESDDDGSSLIDMIPLSVQRTIGIIPADCSVCDVTSHVTSRSPAIGVSCIVTSRNLTDVTGLSRSFTAAPRHSKTVV